MIWMKLFRVDVVGSEVFAIPFGNQMSFGEVRLNPLYKVLHHTHLKTTHSDLEETPILIWGIQPHH